MMTATNIQYEMAGRVQGLSAGGIGAMLLLAHRIGLIRDIDANLHLLKVHLPYHESDHVLNIAFNILAGGERIEHLELRRNDEVYLNALGADRIPDPTTAGDFCRRFVESDVMTLMDTINQVRLRVWAQQSSDFLEEAILDADGTIVPSGSECKRGMDFTYDGQYGFHPLLISLANTGEPLFLFNRSGNRPSQELADVYLDRAVTLCRQAGFRKILLRGDTKFAQTRHLDRWDDAGDIRFVFGYEAYGFLVEARADELPAAAYSLLKRPQRHPIKTTPREKPGRVKQEIVRQRGYETVHLLEEMVAEFEYRPVACKKSYRMIVLRKRVGITRGRCGCSRNTDTSLHYQRSQDDGQGSRVLSQRSLRPGKLDRAAQERCSRADSARGRPGEQLGVYGDGVAGLEPEGLERPSGAGVATAPRET